MENQEFQARTEKDNFLSKFREKLSETEISSQITGIDKEAIKRMHIVFIAISSG